MPNILTLFQAHRQDRDPHPAMDDLKASAAGYAYWGDPTTDGTWRMGRSGVNLVAQRRESGSWVTKLTITP